MLTFSFPHQQAQAGCNPSLPYLWFFHHPLNKISVLKERTSFYVPVKEYVCHFFPYFLVQRRMLGGDGIWRTRPFFRCGRAVFGRRDAGSAPQDQNTVFLRWDNAVRNYQDKIDFDSAELRQSM